MKYVVYTILIFIAALLFLPESGSAEIRNLPILIFIVSIIIVLVLIRLIKHLVLMIKTIKLLKSRQITIIKVKFYPWALLFRGQYTIAYENDGKTVEIAMLLRKKSYSKYHFESADKLEFYRSNRVVFKSSNKSQGANITNIIEVKKVGTQRFRWIPTTETRIILFDKLPSQIGDSVKRLPIEPGETICNSNLYVYDFKLFSSNFI